MEDRGENGMIGRANIGELNLQFGTILAARHLLVSLLILTARVDSRAACICFACGLELNPLAAAILRQDRSTRHHEELENEQERGQIASNRGHYVAIYGNSCDGSIVLLDKAMAFPYVRLNQVLAFATEGLMSDVKHYSNGEVTIVWKAEKCAHSANCFRNLPSVFNPRVKPWIQPNNADTQVIIEVVQGCPSGALTVLDGDVPQPV